MDPQNKNPDSGQHLQYQLQVGDETLAFRLATIGDPVPTGRQILEAAGVHAFSEHLLFQMLGNGALENLRLDETTDLRASGSERFLIFRNDRSFRFELGGRIVEWGAARISGATLKKLANVNPATHSVWLEKTSGDSRSIPDEEFIDLSAPGIERVSIVAGRFTVIVNGRPKTVNQEHLTLLEVVRLAFPQATIDETTAYTVTYKRGPIATPEGSMVDGQTVQLKNGMVFNVTPTNKS